MNDRKVCDVDNFVYEPAPGPPYAGLETGKWWQRAHWRSEANENNHVIMPIILYADGASAGFRRNLSLKPIVVSVGNISGDAQRSDAGKRCIGYWPSIKVLKKRRYNSRYCIFACIFAS